LAPRILVVEDEPAIAENILYALETDGFEPVWKATGQEGLAAALEDGFDLVVLDVMLPDTDGFEVCRQLRKTSQIPVLFLTARAEEIDRVVGLEIGADDYVAKPFSPRELTARIKAILRRSARLTPSDDDPDQHSGTRTPFEIDQARQQILYRGRLLDLSRYEYRLLKILAERPGWVYSRDALMDKAWEDPAGSMERTVDTHIKSLRAKLREVDPDVEAIITRRGIGYCLKEDW
jgi:two-component system catabolic regulation response regulator CreB